MWEGVSNFRQIRPKFFFSPKIFLFFFKENFFCPDWMYAISITPGFNSHCHSGGKNPNKWESSVCWPRTFAHDARTRGRRGHSRTLQSLPSAAKPPTLYSLFKIPYVPYVSVVKMLIFPNTSKIFEPGILKKKLF